MALRKEEGKQERDPPRELEGDLQGSWEVHQGIWQSHEGIWKGISKEVGKSTKEFGKATKEVGKATKKVGKGSPRKKGTTPKELAKPPREFERDLQGSWQSHQGNWHSHQGSWKGISKEVGKSTKGVRRHFGFGITKQIIGKLERDLQGRWELHQRSYILHIFQLGSAL